MRVKQISRPRDNCRQCVLNDCLGIRGYIPNCGSLYEDNFKNFIEAEDGDYLFDEKARTLTSIDKEN